MSSEQQKCPHSGEDKSSDKSLVENMAKVESAEGAGGVYYGDYLQLGKILSAQEPESVRLGEPAHDEMLFIIVHQTYELWFKQILHEIDSVIEILKHEYVKESLLGRCVSRLNRVTEIQMILIDQVKVLETMTAMDFLDFRDKLTPASGFQSLQFRLLENRLGLPQTARISYQNTNYVNYFKCPHQQVLKESTAETSETLLKAVERWLERIPFLKFESFDFWQSYRQAVFNMLDEEKHITETNAWLSEPGKKSQLESQNRVRSSFEILFDENRYQQQYQKGERRLSYGAIQGALLIMLYRDMPMLQIPYQLLTKLMEIDEHLTTWRYRHTMMVQRMIGVKLGTGGSSGYYYLKSTVSERYKIFSDLLNLSTFLIPRSKLPKLPENVEKNLSFHYELKLEHGTK